jgi:hypothetical protein
MIEDSMTIVGMEEDENVEYKPLSKEEILGMLRPDEIFDGMPRAVGLRRISQLILGPIVKTDVQIPKCELNHAVVICSVTYMTPRGLMTFSDAAESSDFNTSEFFMAFPVASSTTKAFGRAFKSAIGLDIVTAEEIAPRDHNPAKRIQEAKKTEKITAEDAVDMGPISEQQKKAVSKLCKLNGVELIKFINMGKKTYNSLDDVKKREAIGMMELLNRYNNDPLAIPESIKTQTEDKPTVENENES